MWARNYPGVFGQCLTWLPDPVTSDPNPTLWHWVWPLEGSSWESASICFLSEFCGNVETSSDGTVSKDTASALLLVGCGFGVMTFAGSLIGWKEKKSGTERLVAFEVQKWDLTRPWPRGLLCAVVGGGIFGTCGSFSIIFLSFSSACVWISTPDSGGQVLMSPPQLQMVLWVVSRASPDGMDPAVPVLLPTLFSSSCSASEKDGSGLMERVRRCSWAEVRRKAPPIKPVGEGAEPRSRLKRARLWLRVTDSSRFSAISARGWKCMSSLGILGFWNVQIKERTLFIYFPLQQSFHNIDINQMCCWIFTYIFDIFQYS